MMAAESTTHTQAIKAKAIDQYLRESPVPPVKGKTGWNKAAPPTLWPEEADPAGPSGSPASKMHQNEEDLYDYGDGAPTTHKKSNATPRRSSLSHDSSEERRGARRASIGYTGEMTLVLPSGETKLKRTSISFADRTDVKEVEPVASLVDNPNRLWFHATEYEHIKERIYEMIDEAKKHNRSGAERPTWVCLRGLEPILDQRLAGERKEAADTLLDEQKAMKRQGNFDQDYLRDMYMFHSVDAQVQAEERAESDAKEVQEYLKITRRMCRRMSC